MNWLQHGGALAMACVALGCEAKTPPTVAATPDATATDSVVSAGDTGSADAKAADTPAPDVPAVADAGVDTGAEIAADVGPDSVADSVADTAPDSVVSDAIPPDVAQPSGDCGDPLADSKPANEEWTSFQVKKAAGPCPPGAVCVWTWTVTKGGAVAKSQGGVASTAQMSAPDYQMLSNLVSNTGFVSAMKKKPWPCSQPPTDILVELELVQPDGTNTQDVTGCVMGGSACNWATVAYQLVVKY